MAGKITFGVSGEVLEKLQALASIDDTDVQTELSKALKMYLKLRRLMADDYVICTATRNDDQQLVVEEVIEVK